MNIFELLQIFTFDKTFKKLLTKLYVGVIIYVKEVKRNIRKGKSFMAIVKETFTIDMFGLENVLTAFKDNGEITTPYKGYGWHIEKGCSDLKWTLIYNSVTVIECRKNNVSNDDVLYNQCLSAVDYDKVANMVIEILDS